MSDRRATTTRPPLWTVALAGLGAIFAVVAVSFARRQSVWTDEATQLSGLSLGFSDQLRWVAGHLPQAFAVPADRMPPLSYWLGSIWIHVFGTGVLTARYLSICLSVASIFALWTVARQYFARWVAFLSAALLALSPNFVLEAAEIRAYAAFILFSTLLIHCYLKLLAQKPTPSSLDLWAFAFVATLCSYTHFFGIVISGGAFVCLLASYLPLDSRAAGSAILRKAKWPLLAYLICMLGIIPFILAAIKISPGTDAGSTAVALSSSARFHDFIHLLYRLFSHQSMLGIPGLSAAALLAGLILIIFAAIPGANPRAKPLLVFLFVNLTLVALVELTTSAFDAFSSSYNIWALPVVVLVAATATTHNNRYIRMASTLSICVVLFADSYAALRLSMAGEIYAHTRSSVVKSAVDDLGPNNVMVLYVNDAPFVYFALMYAYDGRLRQYIARGSTLTPIGPPVGRASLSLCDLSAGTLLIVHDENLSADALQFLIAHPAVHTQAYRALADFLEIHRAELRARWTLDSRNEYLAQSALALAIFKEHPVESSQASAGCERR